MRVSKHIVFVVNNVAFFESHRLVLAKEALERGWQVSLITGKAGSDLLEAPARARLSQYNIRHYDLGFSASGINPLRELLGLMRLFFRLWKIRPNIIHAASPKASIYSGLAAFFFSNVRVVLSISGMGSMYLQEEKWLSIKAIVKPLQKAAYKSIVRRHGVRVIVQNTEDYMIFEQFLKGCVAKPWLVKGSGVDTNELRVDVASKKKERLVLFPARLLRDKGVMEFIAAVSLVKSEFPLWRFVLAGASDYDNPSALTAQETRQLCAESGSEWLGHVENMTELFKLASIVCLPSYREGLPKSLMEAAAASCAVITTDVPGCRDAVVEGITGKLVAPRNAVELANALRDLMNDEELISSYGNAGRRYAEESFQLDEIVAKIFSVYE